VIPNSLGQVNGVKDLIYLLWIALLSCGLYLMLTAMLWLVKLVVIAIFLYYCWWFFRRPSIEKELVRSRFYGFFSFIRRLFP